MYIKMTQRAFNSPLIKYANFKDGSFVNLIKLKKPYANGVKYAVYETTKSPFCSNGFYKTIEEANAKFELMIINGSKCSNLIIKETIIK
tara:strand:- start:509 stop:775 length:267 start_codon:yes stop_codon:yes gene_type:complete